MKGQIFSMDLILQFIIILSIIMIFSINISMKTNNFVLEKEDLILEEKVMLVADSFVKNLSENTLLGSCVYDLDKKRVRSNELDFLKFVEMNGLELEEFFVSAVSVGGARIYYKEEGERCVSVKRLVFVGAEKKVVEVKGCYN
jgi:hypothetical protein